MQGVRDQTKTPSKNNIVESARLVFFRGRRIQLINSQNSDVDLTSSCYLRKTFKDLGDFKFRNEALNTVKNRVPALIDNDDFKVAIKDIEDTCQALFLDFPILKTVNRQSDLFFLLMTSSRILHHCGDIVRAFWSLYVALSEPNIDWKLRVELTMQLYDFALENDTTNNEIRACIDVFRNFYSFTLVRKTAINTVNKVYLRLLSLEVRLIEVTKTQKETRIRILNDLIGLKLFFFENASSFADRKELELEISFLMC